MNAVIGRPPAKINWDIVNELLVKGCSGRQIAGSLGIHQKTLYEHCVIEKGEPFSDYSTRFYAKGEALLIAKQFDKAIEGDNTCLIWLGKTRCKQVEEKQTIVINSVDVKQSQKLEEAFDKSKDLVEHNDNR